MFVFYIASLSLSLSPLLKACRRQRQQGRKAELSDDNDALATMSSSLASAATLSQTRPLFPQCHRSRRRCGGGGGVRAAGPLSHRRVAAAAKEGDDASASLKEQSSLGTLKVRVR